MNRLLVIAAVWIAAAGMIGGAALDAAAKRCNAPQRVTAAETVGWLLWPILLAASVTVDNDSVAYSPCEAKP